ncbi:MAG: hypothetical protein V3S44_05940 [Alphaproteobacteria bacterium]
MFKELFDKSNGTVSKFQSVGDDLGVFTLVLSGVEDPFDPDPLWGRKYGGQPNIAERMSADRDFRLQAALDGCRNIKFVRDEAGRFREQSPIFTDLVVCIPERRWKADALHGGRRIEALASNLTELQRTKFMRSLPRGRDPVYTVMPSAELAEDEVAFQFGFGVFVPSDTDVLQGTIALRADGGDEALQFTDWSMWRDGAQIRRPPGVYRGQGSLLITPDESGPVRAPIWFDHGQGHISINLNAADSERVYADEAYVEVAETLEPEADRTLLRWVLRDAQAPRGDGETLILELTLSEPLPDPSVKQVEQALARRTRKLSESLKEEERHAPEPSVEHEEPEEPEERDAPEPAKAKAKGKARRKLKLGRVLSSMFASPDEEKNSTPLSTRYSLRLSGFALLRIDGTQYVEGLREWILWIDRDGQPLSAGTKADRNQLLALAANADDANLYYRLAGEDDFSPVKVMPSALTTESGRYLDLLPSPLPDIYHGVLLLNPEITFPVSPKPLVIGRSTAKPSKREPDLPLEILNHPKCLRWGRGAGDPNASMNSLNLSRRHLEMRLVGDRLEVALEPGVMPAYILDADGNHLRTLKQDGRSGRQLEPGQQIVIGSYLLRFHQETPQAMYSHRATMARRGDLQRAER